MSNDAAQRYQVRDAQSNVYGPAEIDLLRQWVSQGRIVAGMHIASERDGQWVEVSTHPGLADLFRGTGRPTAAVTPVSTTPAAATYNSPYAGQTAPTPGTDLSQGYTEPPKNNVMALISMIAGIVAAIGLPIGCIPFCGCIVIPIESLVAIVAVVLGLIGMQQIKSAPEKYTGRGMALTGLICGGGALLLYLVGFVVGIAMGLLNR